MNRALVVVSAVVGGVLIGAGLMSAGIAGEPGQDGLPGARAVIDAARYPSLQAALDAVPEEGGMVRIPPGTFEISKPLVLNKGDVLLRGSGMATHIRNINAEGASALILQPADYAKNRRSRIWRVELEDFRITGNEKSGHGIEANGIQEIFIHGVTVSYHGGNGINLDNCYEDPRVADSLITYNKKAGLYIRAGHDIVVAANHFEENMDGVFCTDSFNLCMTGNNLDDHLGNGVVIENTYGSVVSGNMIEECKGFAIVLDRNCYGITLSANVIAHEVKGGIDLRDAHGCAVSANTFTIVKQDGLRIGPKSGRITVTGNNFSDSFIGAEEGEKRRKNDQDASGLVLEGTRDVAVSGNLFSGLSSKAVVLRGEPSRRILFANNLLTEVESDHPGLKETAGSAVIDNLEAEK